MAYGSSMSLVGQTFPSPLLRSNGNDRVETTPPLPNGHGKDAWIGAGALMAFTIFLFKYAPQRWGKQNPVLKLFHNDLPGIFMITLISSLLEIYSESLVGEKEERHVEERVLFEVDRWNPLAITFFAFQAHLTSVAANLFNRQGLYRWFCQLRSPLLRWITPSSSSPIKFSNERGPLGDYLKKVAILNVPVTLFWGLFYIFYPPISDKPLLEDIAAAGAGILGGLSPLGIARRAVAWRYARPGTLRCYLANDGGFMIQHWIFTSGALYALPRWFGISFSS